MNRYSDHCSWECMNQHENLGAHKSIKILRSNLLSLVCLWCSPYVIILVRPFDPCIFSRLLLFHNDDLSGTLQRRDKYAEVRFVGLRNRALKSFLLMVHMKTSSVHLIFMNPAAEQRGVQQHPAIRVLKEGRVPSLPRKDGRSGCPHQGAGGLVRGAGPA